MTESDYIHDALVAVSIIQTLGLPILMALDPVAGAAATPGITALYEGLVKAENDLLKTPEEQNEILRKKITEAAQDYAALQYGAVPLGK